MVRDFGLDYDATDFDWVITVPAIWKAKGKTMMREAGYKVISAYTQRYVCSDY